MVSSSNGEAARDVVRLNKWAMSVLSAFAVIVLVGAISSISAHIFDRERHENDATKRARIREEIALYDARRQFPFDDRRQAQLDQAIIDIAQMRVILEQNQAKLTAIEGKLGLR